MEAAGTIPQEEVVDTHGDQPQSREEQREELFEKIENKIEVIKDILKFCEGFSAPTPHDSPEMVKAEYEAFDRSKRESLKSLGEAAYMRYVRLKELEATPQEKTVGDWDVEISGLYQDPDVMFLKRLAAGVDGIRQKRNDVRGVIQELGDDYLKPSAYDRYFGNGLSRKWLPIMGTISEVVIHPFSISLVIKSEEALGMVLKRQGKPPRGVHIENSIWNVILEDHDLGFQENTRSVTEAFGYNPNSLDFSGEIG